MDKLISSCSPISYYNFKVVVMVHSISRSYGNRNVILKYLGFLLMTESQILLILLWFVAYAHN